MVVVLMGVSGAGKTTIGRLLADALGWEFCDGDDLHPSANKAKMASGVALNDADRAPWLARLHELIEKSLARNTSVVLACSALKKAYREQLAIDGDRVRVVYLRGSRELIGARIAGREHHFMSKDLLDSQFKTLEEPHDVIAVDVAATPESIVENIRVQLGI